VRSFLRKNISNVAQSTFGRKATVAFGAASAFTAYGTLANAALPRSTERRNPPSALSYTYEDWKSRQMEGMRHDGPMGASRRHNTDFGSPYQGPMTSLAVLADQDLYAEREKLQRAEFGAIHGVRGYLFEDFFSPRMFKPELGYNFVEGTRRRREGEFADTREVGTLVLDVTNKTDKYYLEDPDTLVVHQKGKKFSFRLAGIDSPEVGHGFKDTQPFGEEAKAAAQQMLAGAKNVQLVINPDKSTYGRQLGVLYIDGKNYNLETVRRGYANFLPFDKADESMISWKAFENAQQIAHTSNRGMWAEPYHKAFYAATQANGKTITYNTFTNTSKVAASSGKMEILAGMQAAQDVGWNKDVAAEMQRIGGNVSVYSDLLEPKHVSNQNTFGHNKYLNEMQTDLEGYMATHGRKGEHNRLRAHKVRSLDSRLSADSMRSLTSQRNDVNSFRMHQKRTRQYLRQERMAAAQRQQNHSMFQSPIGHNLM
jgi:endonuclease YncB( thermonuclease family)